MPALTTRRDRLSDIVSLGVALLYGAVMVAVGDASAPRAAIPRTVDVAIGVACCVPLLWRCRWPIRVTAVLLPFGAVSVMATGPVLAAIFGVAARRRTSVAVLLGAGHVAMAPLYYLRQPDPTFPLWVDLVVRPLVTAAAVGWGQFVGARRQLLASLRERAERAETEQHLRVEAARRAERARIAREMHDVLAHRISLVSLHAGALEIRTDARPEEIAAAASVIRRNAHEALQELRQVVGILREEPGQGAGDGQDDGGRGGPQAGPTLPEPPQPELRDVPDLVETARAAGTPVTYRTTVEAPGDAPSTTGRTAYRLIQEGLTNVRKHAPGASVDVLVGGGPSEGLRVTVSNPLPSDAAPSELPGAGLGLVGLVERIGLAGGRLEHGPCHDGRTFRLDAWLPWPT